MSGPRIAWMVWCFLWSCAWIVDGFLEHSGKFTLLALLLAAVSGAVAFPAVTSWLADLWRYRPSQETKRLSERGHDE